MVLRLRAARVVIAVALVAVVAGVAVDRWYERVLIAQERERLLVGAQPYAKALAGFFDRRISRLQALRAFVEVQPTLAALNADFAPFANGLGSGASGIRGLQLVKDARIHTVWPPSDERTLAGYDLRGHPQAEVPADYARAMRSRRVTITGPVALLQGGEGLVVRQRVTTQSPDIPDMVVIVLDLASMLSEVHLSSLPTSLRYGLLDRSGRIIQGAPAFTQPIRASVDIGDGTWTLLMEPAAGWHAAVASELRPVRLSLLLIGVMLVAVAALVSGRQRALERAVSERTEDLARTNTALRQQVAERRVLEEQLHQSQKMEAVGTLAGGVAHDFNNLLTAILGFTHLAEQQLEDLLDDGSRSGSPGGLTEVRQDLIEIGKAADRASMLTSQLLAFSRRQKVSPGPLDANTLVHDLERMLQRLLGETVSLVTELASDPLPVMADSGQFSQVVLNLVVNARDALPRGGLVRVSTRSLATATPAVDGPLAGLAAGSWVLVTVEDNGTGMTPEVQARMFEPFFTTKPLGHGTGLGLSTVYGIVTQAGGQLFVESVPERGTKVTVAWPRFDGPVTASRSVTADRTSNDALILVVEDEPGLRRLVGEILRRRGHRVRVAEDGVAALEQLDGGLEPALVLTDVVMPRMGGRELASEMARRGLATPVLFMSGYQAGEELPDDDSHGFIGKPFTPDTIVRAVRKALDAAAKPEPGGR